MKFMKLKGIEEFLARIPDYRGKRMVLIPFVVIASFIGPLLLMILIDISPRLFPSFLLLQSLEPVIPLISTVLFQVIGILLVRKIWTKKDRYLDESRERAYQKAFKYVLTGIPLFVASMLHGFIPVHLIPPTPLMNSPTWYMANPITTIIDLESVLIGVIRVIFGSIFLFLGIGTVLRALFTFGIDYMAIVYIYYPEESKLQRHEIYSILRHPAYHGLILMSFSSVFFRFSLYSILICILFIIGMNVHLKFTEDRELISRFGPSYLQYMNCTNALFFHPKHLKKYFLFLFGANEDIS